MIRISIFSEKKSPWQFEPGLMAGISFIQTVQLFIRIGTANIGKHISRIIPSGPDSIPFQRNGCRTR